VDYQDKIENLKRNVTQMLLERNEQTRKADGQPLSPIWSEALSVLDYAINLSPKNFLNIRFHTDLFTGEPICMYWHPHPPIDPEKYAGAFGYRFLTEDIPEAYWVSEPEVPGSSIPLGINYRGKIINQPTIRYQRCISNLYLAGILPQFLEKEGNSIILEVGGGHGGLAHALGSILTGKSTYIIIDLPEMLLFSGGYLIVNNPQKNIYLYEKSTFTPEFLKEEIHDYDYVLIPNYVVKDLYALDEINLMANLLSFPEMTREQVDEYLQLGHSKLSGYLCSDNMDKHPYNNQLAGDTITTILESRFHLFPPPQLYEGQFEEHAWNTKFYFGISNDKEHRFPEGGRIKHMAGKDRFTFCYSDQAATV